MMPVGGSSWARFARVREVLDGLSDPGSAVVAAALVRLPGGRLDDRVARYWPEFAAHGKGGTTVRHVLSHAAGLPALDVVNSPFGMGGIGGCDAFASPAKGYAYVTRCLGDAGRSERLIEAVEECL